MISLKDEIKKFEKMVYNKELAEFVTVDQMFVGGGITIESMIHESNFIVEELKKMGAVFLNYCKLNEKVYTKIMQHELSIHNEHSRLNGLANSVERQIGDMLKTLKELHESTVSENVKSYKMLESIAEPLKKELEKKVDKIAFESQMKKFLEEYDEGGFEKDNLSEGGGEQGISTGMSNQGASKEPGGSNQNLSQTVLSEDGQPIVKKKGKVGFQDFYKFQAQLSAKMKENKSKLDQASTTAEESKQLILKYLPVINRSATETSLHSSEIYRLSNEITVQKNQFEVTTNKMFLELNNRTSDQVWVTKLEGFYDKSIKPIIIQIEEASKSTKMQLSVNRVETQKKIQVLNQQLKSIKSRIQQVDNNLKKNTKQISVTNSQVKSNFQQFLKQKQHQQKSIQNLKNEISSRFKDIQKQTKSQLTSLKNALQSLINTIGESVLKTVNKRIQSQLKVIESQIKANREKIKGIKSDVGSVCDEIKNIKELLAKKANYSDIIHHVQKKADREQFKDLQIRFHESSQQLVSKNLNESLNQSKYEIIDKHRASSLTRASKTHFVPKSSPRKLNKTDFDTSTKLFMCGLEGHLGEAKSAHSQHARRRSMKSSAAMISEFVE